MESYEVDVYRDRGMKPIMTFPCLEDAIFHIDVARTFMDDRFDPDRYTFVILDQAGDPKYELELRILGDAEVFDFKDRRGNGS